MSDDDLTTAWMAGNERGKDAMRARVAELEAALREAQAALADNALSQEHGGNGISPEYFAAVRDIINKALERK